MKDFLKVVVFGGIFLVPFLPIYVENDFFFPFITGKNFAFRIIVEVMVAAWVVLALLDKQYRPRFSWILAGFSALIGVMFFANLLGEYPLKSFWSNFERMDGYVTLVHVFLLIVVMGSVMKTEKLWTYFFYTSVAVAAGVALYGAAQVAGLASGWTGRMDSRLGNAAYMAIYMLFHIFIVAWLAVRSKNRNFWIGAGFVLALLTYGLIMTATRGTFLGLVGGVAVTVGYMAFFGRKYPELRKYAMGGIFVLIIATLLFLGFRDSAFVQGVPQLARIANIDLAEDLEVRGVIWSMALKGVAERPILGWGQGNFNYIFNEQFEPELWNREAWFDRVHNIVLDWLVAGGVLGFLAYASIFFALAYYLVWLPLMKGDNRLDVLERSVLVGLVVGYLMHNLVVFDNIISYIFFACILALIHFRVSEPMAAVEKLEVDDKVVTQIVAPIALVFTLGIVYFVNIPGIQASGDIIDAMRESSIQGRLQQFHDALARESFADQEIVEQLAQQAMGVAANPNVPENEKQLIVQRAELELLKLVENKPNDARLHNFLGTFYRSIGALDQAREQAAIARSLTPRKPAIILEQGVIELQAGNNEAAQAFFKDSYEMAPDNFQTITFYAATEVRLGNTEFARELVGETFMPQFAKNDFALNTVYQSGDLPFLAEMFKERIKQDPQNAQNWGSLSFIYYELEDVENAVATLEEAKAILPGFGERADCFIAAIEAGGDPAASCSQ